VSAPFARQGGPGHRPPSHDEKQAPQRSRVECGLTMEGPQVDVAAE